MKKTEKELIEEYLKNGGKIKKIISPNVNKNTNDYKFNEEGKLVPQKRLISTKIYIDNKTFLDTRENVDDNLRNYGN